MRISGRRVPVAQKSTAFKRCLMVACMTVLALTAAQIMPPIQSAQACWSTVTTSGSYGPAGVGSYTIDVNQFNPTNGVLKEAIFTLQGNLSGTYSFTDNDGSNEYAYWGQTGNTSISYGRMNLYYTVSSGMDPNYVQANMNMVGPFASHQTITGTIYTGNLSQHFMITTPSQLSAFIGIGTLPFSLVVNQNDELTYSGGNFNSIISESVSATVTAQYEYASTPIPGTIFLFAPALVGLSAIRRRLQKAG